MAKYSMKPIAIKIDDEVLQAVERLRERIEDAVGIPQSRNATILMLLKRGLETYEIRTERKSR